MAATMGTAAAMGTAGSQEEFLVATTATVTSPQREGPPSGSQQGSAVTDSPPPPPITEPTLQFDSQYFYELEFYLRRLEQHVDWMERQLQQSRVLIDRLVGRIVVLEEKLDHVGRAASESVPKAKALAY